MAPTEKYSAAVYYLNGDILCLTSPRPMGQGAREGTFLAGEIVQPIAGIFSSRPLFLVQATWIVATLWITSDSALMLAVSAPFEIAE